MPESQPDAPTGSRWYAGGKLRLPVAILLALLILTFGWAPFAGESSPVGAIRVAPGVTIHPLKGWTRTGRFTEGQGVRLSRGAVHLDVWVFTFSQRPVDLWNAYLREFVSPDASQLQNQTTLDPIELDSGLAAVRGWYIGIFRDVATPIEGEIAATVGSIGKGVVFDGWAAKGNLTVVLDEIRRMTREAEVE